MLKKMVHWFSIIVIIKVLLLEADLSRVIDVQTNDGKFTLANSAVLRADLTKRNICIFFFCFGFTIRNNTSQFIGYIMCL